MPSPRAARRSPARAAALKRGAASGAALALILVASSCAALLGPEPPRTVSVVSYNVLSLFDGRDDGGEFRDFSVAAGSWDESRYRKRLGLLAEVLLAAAPGGKGPDIAVLAEIENEGVLEDLASGPLAAGGYRWRAIAPLPGAPFASGVISRHPIARARAHALAAGGSESRNLLEARIELPGGRSLTVFALHWKSKVGGAGPTEAARREAAALAARLSGELLAADARAEFLLAGDFNESPDEWRRTGRSVPTALFPASEIGALPDSMRDRVLLVAAGPADAGLKPLGPGGRPASVLHSPWTGRDGWSYLHEGAEERIDGFLLSPGLLDGEGLSLAGFRPLALPFLLDASGAPLAWSTRTGRGYSDHLPLLLELRLDQAGADSRPRMKKSQKKSVESP